MEIIFLEKENYRNTIPWITVPVTINYRVQVDQTVVHRGTFVYYATGYQNKSTICTCSSSSACTY
jgi:hypothetical protein